MGAVARTGYLGTWVDLRSTLLRGARWPRDPAATSSRATRGGCRRTLVDALDRRHVGVAAAVADLDVGLAREPTLVGSAPTQTGSRSPGSSASSQAWVCDLHRVLAAVLGRRPEIARDVARRDAARAAAGSAPRWTKSWQTPPPASNEVLDGRADVGRSRVVLEAVGDQLDERSQRRERRVVRRTDAASSSIVGAPRARRPSASRNSPPASLYAGMPSCSQPTLVRLRRLGGHDPRAHVDDRWSCGLAMPNSRTSVPK